MLLTYSYVYSFSTFLSQGPVRHNQVAFEALFEKYPTWQAKVVLMQITLQTITSSEVAAGEVTNAISRIKLAVQHVDVPARGVSAMQDLTFSQCLALLTVADAFCVTRLSEGMMLRTHGYVECQCQEGKYKPLGS